MRLFEVTVTTAADGSATAYLPSEGKCRGELEMIQYEKIDFADTVDFTITDEVTGESLWTDTNITASEIVRPRAPVMDQAGAPRLYAAGGTAVSSKIAIVSRIKIVIAAGGNAKSGKFRVHIN